MGLTEAELQLCELLGQVIELLRWNQVLGYSNQYLLNERLGVPPEERHRVMRAAAGAVEQDGRMQDWGRRLLEIQDALQKIHERLDGTRVDSASIDGGSIDGNGAAEGASGA